MRSRNATTQLDHIFYALSDPTRRGILAALSKGETTVGALAGKSHLTLPAISKHLKVLEKGKLIHRKGHPKDGRVYVLELEPRAMKKATDWLEEHRQYWNKQFDALEKFLEQNPKKGEQNERK